MKITTAWWACPRCGAPITEIEIESPGFDFPEIRTTDVIVTPPVDGSQVDTEYDHECM